MRLITSILVLFCFVSNRLLADEAKGFDYFDTPVLKNIYQDLGDADDENPTGFDSINTVDLNSTEETPVEPELLVWRDSGNDLDALVGLDDSVEGYNRCAYSFNDAFLLWVMRPVFKVYSYVVPKSGRKGIDNAAVNIEFPVRMFSCFCQGRFNDGSVVLSRFFINTTVGAAGTYDAADYFWQIKRRDEDFGQAFASWGIGPGCYLVVPLIGPSSMRDAVGIIFDYAFDPKTWVPVPGVQLFSRLNRGSLNIDDYERMTDSNLDPYLIVRDFWYLDRKVRIEQ